MGTGISRSTARIVLVALSVVSLGVVAALLASPSRSAAPPRSVSWSLTEPLVVANLPVDLCATSYGAPESRSDALPSHQLALVASRLWRSLVMYADGLGTLYVLGPKGWSCTALDAVDGASTLVVFPPGEPRPSTGDLTAVRTGIVATQTGGCAGCSLETACPLFRAASLRYAAAYGVHCRQIGAAERRQTPSPSRVLFVDPPGVLGAGRPSGGADAAYGAMLWHLPGDPRSTAWLDTCTLPDAQRTVCVLSVHAFLARHPDAATTRGPRQSR
ncbi:MAG TPA: hypothetical protein VIE15_07445 [Acidimicrobiales bacterium]